MKGLLFWQSNLLQIIKLLQLLSRILNISLSALQVFSYDEIVFGILFTHFSAVPLVLSLFQLTFNVFSIDLMLTFILI